MFNLTPNERLAACVVLSSLFIGNILHVVAKQNPQLFNLINAIEQERLIIKVDLNTASYDELVSIPYIGQASAQAILTYRKHNGRFNSVEQLLDLPVIRPRNYERFKPYVVVYAL